MRDSCVFFILGFFFIINLFAKGVARAQCNLGQLHERGVGVPLDLARAVEWYQKAVDQGYSRAQVR